MPHPKEKNSEGEMDGDTTVQFTKITGRKFIILGVPPAQNQYMQEKILGELIFPRMHVGPVFALARIQENIFEESFSAS